MTFQGVGLHHFRACAVQCDWNLGRRIDIMVEPKLAPEKPRRRSAIRHNEARIAVRQRARMRDGVTRSDETRWELRL